MKSVIHGLVMMLLVKIGQTCGSMKDLLLLKKDMSVHNFMELTSLRQKLSLEMLHYGLIFQIMALTVHTLHFTPLLTDKTQMILIQKFVMKRVSNS